VETNGGDEDDDDVVVVVVVVLCKPQEGREGEPTLESPRPLRAIQSR
jgi:hypothetical protein